MSCSVFIKTVPSGALEPRILQKISHPHIIKLRECQEAQGYIKMVFEYYPKLDLSKQIKERVSPFKESTVRLLLIQMLQALEYLHGLHIIHRDVKPHNILIASRTRFVLADLGSAREISAKETSYKAFVKTITGTPMYIAPEIISKLCYDEKADIYSLGVTVIEMMQLRNPFISPGENASFTQLVHKIATGEMHLDESFWMYSKELVSTVLNMTSLNENARHSATQLLDQLGVKDRQEPPCSLPATPVNSASARLQPDNHLTRKIDFHTQLRGSEAALYKYYRQMFEKTAASKTESQEFGGMSEERFQFWAKLVLLE